MGEVVKTPLFYEEMGNKFIKRKHVFRKKDLKMSEVTAKKPNTKVDKQKNTLSIYTYLNFKRFGVMLSIDNGIKINILWFETHIKFEKR